jgi:4-aminobutyrate aminotransferase
LLLYYVGAGRKVLELTPPLVITEAEVDRGAAILEQALADTADGKVDAAAAAEWGGW